MDSEMMELSVPSLNLMEEELEASMEDLIKKRTDFCGIQSAKKVSMQQDAVFALPTASTE
jgi:hypothetical protein